MNFQKLGGIASIIEALTYIFGIVLFIGILDPSVYDGATGKLKYMIENRDLYVLGLFVSGFLFSFALIILVQALQQKLAPFSPHLMQFATAMGYFWASIVLASAMIEVVSIHSLAHYYATDPEMALVVSRAVAVIAGGLGGDIELIGAIWAGLISIVGIKHGIFNRWLNYWGLTVAIAGGLTLCAFVSALKDNPVIEVMTLIFGLGQIPWFIWLGISLYTTAKE